MAVIINGNNLPTSQYAAFGNGTELDFANALLIDKANASIAVGAATSAAQFVYLGAGTASKAPLRLTNGTNMTTPNPGVMEFDGATLSFTNDSDSLRGYVGATNIFRLTAAGAAIGPAISNFYGANSAVNLTAGGVYKITAYLYFTKTTAGTVTVTITSSSAPTSVSGILQTGAVAGGAAIGASNQAALFNNATTGAAFGATGSLTNNVNYAILVEAIYVANAATNVRFNVTSGAGTVTPLAHSYYTVTRLPAGNSGNFVA